MLHWVDPSIIRERLWETSKIKFDWSKFGPVHRTANFCCAIWTYLRVRRRSSYKPLC
jgi:hypothetical protein